MIRKGRLLYAAAIAAAAASPLPAATISWQGGSGDLISANYTDTQTPFATNLTPAAADNVNFGASGVGTRTSGTTTLTRLRVGHSLGPAAQSALRGPGTLTISNGAKLNLGGTGAGTNAGLLIGNNQTGSSVTITDNNSNITVGRLVVVGYGSSTGRNATLNVNNGGSLTITLGNLVLGETDDASPPAGGNQGRVNVNGGTITLTENAADLLIGAASAVSQFTQATGTTSIGDQINIGASGASNGSFLRLQGGTLTSRTGAIFVGTGSSQNATLHLEGGTLSTSGGGNVTVGAGTTAGSTSNISGGTFNVGNRYLNGTADSTNTVTNHSGGTVNIDLDLRVADTLTSAAAVATYNLSGNGILNTNVEAQTTGTLTIVGRRGTGRFFQTGGTANFNSPLMIGNRDVLTPTVAANGYYEISAGNLNVNSPSPTWANALSIAPNGTGELRIIGDDATIDVNGNFVASSTVDGVGTLAYALQANELVSVIDVSGTATFGLGTKLKFNVANAPMTQYVYDLLTAPTIADLGIDFEGPGANWYHRIVPGGSGFILQAVAPEPSALGLMLLAAIGGLFRHRGR